MAPPNGTPAHYKRKRYVIDRKWQLSVSRGVVAVALAAAVLYSFANHALATSDPIQSLSGRQLGLLALVINSAYFALLLVVLTVVIVRYTHAVAGPAMVIEHAVEGMIEGKYDRRLTLRRRDYLKSLAATIKRLAQQMEQRESDQDRVCMELEEALARGEHDAALELVQRLRDARGLAPAEADREPGVAA